MSDQVLDFPRDYIAEYDEDDTLSTIESLGDDVVNGFNAARHLDLEEDEAITIVASGGAYDAAVVASSMFDDVHARRDHGDVHGTIVAGAYYGTDGPVVRSYRLALRDMGQAIGVSRGGKMKEVARVHDEHYLQLPSGFGVTTSFGFCLGVYCRIAEEVLGVSVQRELKGAKQVLQRKDMNQHAVALAEKLQGNLPVIYAVPQLEPVANRWRSVLTMVAGVQAVVDIFPRPIDTAGGVVQHGTQVSNYGLLLTSDVVARRMQDCVSAVRAAMQSAGVDVTELKVKGKSPYLRTVTGVLLGDLVAYYLALLYERDPSKNMVAERLRSETGE
jgi:hypothetical protein